MILKIKNLMGYWGIPIFRSNELSLEEQYFICCQSQLYIDYYTFLRIPCRVRKNFVFISQQVAEARKKEIEELKKL